MQSFSGHYHDNTRVAQSGELVLLRRVRPGAPEFDLRALPEAATLEVALHAGVAVPAVLDHAFAELTLSWTPGVPLSELAPARTRLPFGMVAQIATMLCQTWEADSTLLRQHLPAAWPTTTAGFYQQLLDFAQAVAERYSAGPALLAACGVPGVPWTKFQRLGAGLADRHLVFCHGDVHRDNLIVDRGRLTLIDWELALIGDPVWDLAVAINRSYLVPDDVAALLTVVQTTYPLPQLQHDLVAYRDLESLKSVMVDAVRFPQVLEDQPRRLVELAADLREKVAVVARHAGVLPPELTAVQQWLAHEHLPR